MSTNDLAGMLAERPLRFGGLSATGHDRFDYQPGQPNLYMLMRLKQALVRERGIKAGFELYRSAIVRQADSTLEQRALRSHHEHCVAHAIQFHEIFPPGESVNIEPPRVIGRGDHRPLAGTTRSFYLSCLEDACVRGRSAITEIDGLALADFQKQELALIDDEMEFDSGVFHRDDEQLWTIADARPALEFDAAFSLLGARTDFFGDWLCDYVTRYVAATMARRLPAMPILIDACMPASHRQAIEMMLPSGTEIVEIPSFIRARVKRLWQAASICYMPFHQILNEKFRWDYNMSSSERFLPVEDEMALRADRALGATTGPARVFLARKSFRHRKMVNHVEIEAIAAAHDFVVAYPEDLDFVEQVRLVRNAQHVIGPEGSALFLSYFLKPCAELCILSHEETESLTLYNWADGLKDRKLTVISGPEIGVRKGRSLDMDYAIDAGVFSSFLSEWLDKKVARGIG